ncbi:MAG TPA: SGNH/GDSL hydrolase family protein [Drouetiella sp.]
MNSSSKKSNFNFKNALSRFASSTFLLVAAVFAIGYVTLFFGLKSENGDMASLQLPAWMTQFTQTLPKYLNSPAKPDVLLMGSSLVLSPAALLEKLEHRTGFGCTYFENQIQQRTGKHIAVDNVGVIAGMVVDQYTILKASIDAGKKPTFVIYGMAPRDLADNLTSAENSPTQQVLAMSQKSKSFFPTSLNPQDLEVCWNTHKLTASHWMKSIRLAALDVASKASHHPATVTDSTPAKSENLASEHTHMVVIPADLELYRQRYNPPNFDRMKGQAKYLESLLSLCAANHIPILLVNMPLPDVNRNVIPKPLLAEYKQTVKDVASKYPGCELIDLDQNTAFADNLNNFNDCVHLNANGGKKFFNMLADYLVNDKPFDVAYSVQPPSVAQSAKGKVF